MGRAYFAQRRTAVLRQVRARVRNDVLVAAFHMQNVMRIILARRALTRKRIARDRLGELMEHAARRIVSFFRMVFGKSLADRLRAEIARLRVVRTKAALVVERCTRGLFGRQRARRRKVFVNMINFKATELQRAWRGSRVMAWKHLRMNKIAGAVFARQDFERSLRSAAVEERYAAWMRALTKDSCSDSDGGFGDLDHAWVEKVHKDGTSTWYNTKSGESAEDDPRRDPVINEIIGCSVRVYWPLMDAWYEGTLAKYHRRKKRYRVEYHDGDHEWLNLESNMDRVQLFDANGEWSELQYAFRPALEARQRRKDDREALRKRSALLEEETRAWEIIGEPEKDEMNSYDEEAEVAKPLADRFGDKPPKEKWLNTMTGEIKFLSDDAIWWMESRDEHKNFCFEHGETGERVYTDPRFEKDVDTPNVKAWKAECLAELRHSVYLGSALVEDWDRDGGKKNRQEILKKVLRNAKLFVRSLTTSITQARDLWGEEEFKEDPELVYASYILRRVNEMREAADLMVFEFKQKKMELLASSRRWRGLICKSCKHTCMDQAATHCPTCGVRLDSRVTIAMNSAETSKQGTGKNTPVSVSRPTTADRAKKKLLAASAAASLSEGSKESDSSSFNTSSLEFGSQDLGSLASKSHASNLEPADEEPSLGDDAPLWMKEANDDDDDDDDEEEDEEEHDDDGDGDDEGEDAHDDTLTADASQSLEATSHDASSASRASTSHRSRSSGGGDTGGAASSSRAFSQSSSLASSSGGGS